jgi:hypothetical protein
MAKARLSDEQREVKRVGIRAQRDRLAAALRKIMAGADDPNYVRVIARAALTELESP